MPVPADGSTFQDQFDATDAHGRPYFACRTIALPCAECKRLPGPPPRSPTGRAAQGRVPAWSAASRALLHQRRPGGRAPPGAVPRSRRGGRGGGRGGCCTLHRAAPPRKVRLRRNWHVSCARALAARRRARPGQRRRGTAEGACCRRSRSARAAAQGTRKDDDAPAHEARRARGVHGRSRAPPPVRRGRVRGWRVDQYSSWHQ